MAETATVDCVACAEQIKSAAKLCKHCGTRQDDPSFTASFLSPPTLPEDAIELADLIESCPIQTLQAIIVAHPADEHQWECETCVSFTEEYDDWMPCKICGAANVSDALQREILDQSLTQIDASLTNEIVDSICWNKNTTEQLLFEVCNDFTPVRIFEVILEHPNCSARVKELIEDWTT